MATLVRATHAAKLERWLGAEPVEHLARAMVDWYGPPIPVAGVPGAVWAHRGGEFRGRIASGEFVSGVEWAVERLRSRWRRATREARALGVGLGSITDAAASGKARDFFWNKVGATGVVGVTNSLWGLGPHPAAGANAANAPGGEAPTDATTGAWPFTNPTGGDLQRFVSAWATANFVNSLLLYDRIFQVNKTMNSTGAESVTGVPTRYQGSVGAADSPEGNFLFVEVGGTALAATAHNWTVCRYRDQDGNDQITLPSLTGNASAIVRRLDHPTLQWFAPLATGDTGVKDLDQMQCSAAVATGVINFVIGHPLAWIPVPLVNLVCVADGINTAFGLARIFDDAALALLEVCKPATNATTYNVAVRSVAWQ